MNAPLKRRISLVIPAYNEAGNIQRFYQEVTRECQALDSYSWKFHFIDDGSQDDTWEEILLLSEKDPRVVGIRLSRNFGKEVALTAGAESVAGTDAVIFIDADLQHPPALIPELVRQWEQGYQIVATKREDIEYSLMREWGSRAFYWFLNRFSALKITPQTTDFRLLDRKVLAVLLSFEERTRFFRGLIDWMGFKKIFVPFSSPNRQAGESSFRFKDLFNLAINSMTSFSLLPLRFTGYLGVFTLTMGSLVLFFMVMTQFFFENQYYTPLAYFVVFNTLLFGVVMASLGMVALYIGHIHTEVIRRPLYIIMERTDQNDDG